MLSRAINKNKLIALAMLFCCIFAAKAQTPVEKYGQLQIKNGKVSDKNGNPVVLRGMSLFWSGYPEGSPYYNAQTIKWLRDDWCVDVIRIPMSVETGTNGNYISNATNELNRVKTVVQACIDNGIYAIVDFHTHNADQYETQAKKFFTDIATLYGNKANVLYEPFNEPIYQDWNGVIKPYHNRLVQTIRAIDPDNIIICGTRLWSQEVDVAAANPVTGTNIAYTLHYYANSHKGELRSKADNAIAQNAALFVTEYGTCDASGNGGYNAGESQTWWTYLESKKIGSCNWSVCNKNETSAAISSGTSATSGWTTSQLSTSGNLVRNYIKGKCNVVVTTGSITLSFAGSKTQYAAGETVSITANATVSNGSIDKVEFFRNGISLGIDKTSGDGYTASFTATAALAGGHDITAKSYDINGNVIAESPIYNISIVGASDISTTGVTDQFESADQFTELTGGVNGTSCSTAKDASAIGIYWWEEKVASTPFAATYTRTGNGKITYTLSQAANAYEVFGFSFGEYCNGTAKKKFAMNLSQNAVFNITVSTPSSNTETLDLKFQMKDINGKTLAFKNSFTSETVKANYYKYEIGYSKNHTAPDFVSLAPGATSNFTFDFKNALTIKGFTFPADINSSNSDFDFTQVTEIIIIPVNSKANASYQPLAFTNQQIIFSGLKLGDPTLGSNFCTTPKAVTATDKTYCENATSTALTATGTTGLSLKWYTVATNGTASTTAPKPSTETVGETTYYVSQSVPGSATCEGPRTAVKAIVIEAPFADAGTDMTIKQGTSAALEGNGTTVGTWKLVSGPVGATVTFSPSANVASATANGLSVLGKYNFSYTVAGTSPCGSTTDDMDVTVSEVTAINNSLYLKEVVEIYPNPFTDKLSIDLSKVNGNKSMKLVDMLGRVVFESANENSVSVEMADLNKGMYFIHVQSESGNMIKSVIKQ